MPAPSLAWPVSADPTMRRDGPFRTRAPLTAIESARRVAVFKASQEPGRPLAAAVSSEMLAEAAAVADTTVPECDNTSQYGHRAAKILSDCRRDVALAPEDTKKIVFQEVAKRIGEAVTDQWLTKAAMMDRLQDIAEGHGSFGLNPEQLQQLIADAAEAIHVPPIAPPSAPLKRRLI